MRTEMSVHFRLEQVAAGVYAAIACTGGAAHSNAGIVDLGDLTFSASYRVDDPTTWNTAIFCRS
jgi:hypothetical protein